MLPPVTFPADEAPHQDLTEWWYYTGHLEADDGRQWGFELVTFQVLRTTLQPLYISHFAITDQQRGQFQYVVKGSQGPQAQPPLGFAFDVDGQRMNGLNGSDALQASLDGYKVDQGRVTLIPHGAPDNRSPERQTPQGGRPTILTWGLLGPGKGVEWAIDALAELRDLDPAPRYLVVGETHPKVLERDGEEYRRSLLARAAAGGVGHLLEFEDRYLDLKALNRIVAGADVVILPYDSREQVTSGVLVEAMAAGKPVIATGFPHAVELLGNGTGLIVPHGDSLAMAKALCRVLTEPGLAARLGARAAALAPQLFWPAVAGRYRNLAGALLDQRASAVA